MAEECIKKGDTEIDLNVTLEVKLKEKYKTDNSST